MTREAHAWPRPACYLTPLHAQLHRRQFNGALELGYPVSLSREMANGDKERKKQSGPRSSRGPRPPCCLAHAAAAACNYFLSSLELPESSLSRAALPRARSVAEQGRKSGCWDPAPRGVGLGQDTGQTTGESLWPLTPAGWLSASHPTEASGQVKFAAKVFRVPRWAQATDPAAGPGTGEAPQGASAGWPRRDAGGSLDFPFSDPHAPALSSIHSFMSIHLCSRRLLGDPWVSARGVPDTGGHRREGHTGRVTTPGPAELEAGAVGSGPPPARQQRQRVLAGPRAAPAPLSPGKPHTASSALLALSESDYCPNAQQPRPAARHPPPASSAVRGLPVWLVTPEAGALQGGPVRRLASGDLGDQGWGLCLCLRPGCGPRAFCSHRPQGQGRLASGRPGAASEGGDLALPPAGCWQCGSGSGRPQEEPGLSPAPHTANPRPHLIMRFGSWAAHAQEHPESRSAHRTTRRGDPQRLVAGVRGGRKWWPWDPPTPPRGEPVTAVPGMSSRGRAGGRTESGVRAHPRRPGGHSAF